MKETMATRTDEILGDKTHKNRAIIFFTVFVIVVAIAFIDSFLATDQKEVKESEYLLIEDMIEEKIPSAYKDVFIESLSHSLEDGKITNKELSLLKKLADKLVKSSRIDVLLRYTTTDKVVRYDADSNQDDMDFQGGNAPTINDDIFCVSAPSPLCERIIGSIEESKEQANKQALSSEGSRSHE